MTNAVDRFNALPGAEAEAGLLACCASRKWAAAVLAGRPYAEEHAVLAASDAAFGGLTRDDVTEALGAHPRIGERAGGNSREAAWSRSEQSAAATGEAAVRADLVAGNHAYEERFGHVFLICATGRSAAEILAALRSRLGNDDDAERAVVREELRKIAALRLTRWLQP